MNANGTNQVRLTTTSATELQPSWTPDGSHIVFMSDRDGQSEIYMMDADGSNQTRLTTIPGGNQFPHVQP
jgi:Tol biopolymer transport system component